LVRLRYFPFFVAVYIVDYAVLRYRIARDLNPYGTVTIQWYYAIQEKNGKTEYDFQPPQPEQCINSLFPHSGFPACWYERRHAEKRIQI
jgi:hypothetical protein